MILGINLLGTMIIMGIQLIRDVVNVVDMNNKAINEQNASLQLCGLP